MVDVLNLKIKYIFEEERTRRQEYKEEKKHLEDAHRENKRKFKKIISRISKQNK